jgi:hypothetical protein
VTGEGGYSVEERLARVELAQTMTAHTVDKVSMQVDALDMKLDARPSWVVVFLILFLQGVCGVLASALVYELTK